MLLEKLGFHGWEETRCVFSGVDWARTMMGTDGGRAEQTTGRRTMSLLGP